MSQKLSLTIIETCSTHYYLCCLCV